MRLTRLAGSEECEHQTHDVLVAGETQRWVEFAVAPRIIELP